MYLFAVVISSSAADGGDMEGARKMGRVAFWLNIASYIIAAVAIVSAIIWFVVSVTTAASSTGEALAFREPGNDCRHNGRILVQDNFDDS